MLRIERPCVQRRRLAPQMLEKPDIPDHHITYCLHQHYGFKTVEITFLPLGADRHTAVYQVITDDSVPYFVKLRAGPFAQISVSLPKFLHDQGMKQVIAPLPTSAGQLWADFDSYKMIVSPFVAGYHGFEVDLQAHHWIALGQALRFLHGMKLPLDLWNALPREDFSPYWREAVRGFQRLVETTFYHDPISHELAGLLKDQQGVVTQLVDRAEALADALHVQRLPLVPCHADIHVGNVLIDHADKLYVVDWDTLLLAPPERDLMFVGGGLGGGRFNPEEENRLFYEGYGHLQPDLTVIHYYRCERIIQDIAAYCEQILLTEGDSQDRQMGLTQLRHQFDPGQVVEIALSELGYPRDS